MDEFPDPEDEFDLMHEDEYEVLRELEAAEAQPPAIKSALEQQKTNASQSTKNNKTPAPETPFKSQNGMSQVLPAIGSQQNHSKEPEVPFENQNGMSQALPVIESQRSQSKVPFESTKKRSIDHILQDASLIDLDSMLFDDGFELQKPKRLCWDKPQELIQFILEKRKGLHTNGIVNNYENLVTKKDKSDSISKRVPLWNFVAVTHYDDGERFYIKVSNKNKYVPTNVRPPSSNSLLKSFTQLKVEAEKILVQNVEKAELVPAEPRDKKNLSCELWVDKYRPKKYLELLSDENVNITLLHWLKLWDKIVFDRDPTVRSKKPQVQYKGKNKYKKKEEEDIPDHDSKGFPTRRIALLTGPPGLGKTTLAHVVARHSGYNIVELNASDDRGPEAFREALLASTQMRALIDKDKRPNCLILDEIDGAPSASIELLLKFIHGKLAPKGKTLKDKQGNKENDGCRRPIICICNDLYTPSLRPLRSMALVINVPEISPSTLADRLLEIAYKEGLSVDSRTLLQLAERSGCDVRACLGILQYTGGRTDMLQNLAFGLKDMHKGLFESWKELLRMPVTRTGHLSNTERVQKVIQVVHQGEPDRLVQGIFHNYPETCKDQLIPVYKAMQWFEFYDEVNSLVRERQTWMLMPYTTSAFVAWHMYLAGSQNPKISYPTTQFEVAQKTERNLAILMVTKKTSKVDILTLVSEFLPYLPDLMCPKLRSVNSQLYSPKEKQELNNLVNLMLDFGLTFTQEKTAEGRYDYVLDPNVWDIGVFSDCKVRKPLPYAVKQIVIQELETARLQRAAIMSGEKTNDDKKTNAKPKAQSNKMEIAAPTPSQSENLPNHLRQLNPIELKPAVEKKCRNFFQAFQLAGQEKLKEKQAREKEEGIVSPEAESRAEKQMIAKKKNDLLKSAVWYQYKEGYSNAVRRTILMKDLF